MIIQIATTRLPKINGVKKAAERISTHFGIDFSTVQFEAKETQSGVSDMPLSIEESMLGAKQRATNLFKNDSKKNTLSIGVEGGLFQIDGKVFLQSWSCVYNGIMYSYGSSGSIELPKDLSSRVIHDGIELSVAIDKFVNQSDVRSKQGTFGILTDDLLTREDSFEMATFLALIPHFHKKIYIT